MGQVLEPERTYEVDAVDGNGSRACFASIQGWRQSQEDDHTIHASLPSHNGVSFYAVFDGHGGPQASYFAAQNTANIFEQIYKGEPEADKVADALKQAVMQTDKAMLADETGLGRRKFYQEGCTGILCVVTSTHVICANVGDSRAILVTLQDGKSIVEPLSEDQKPGNEKEGERIRAAGMAVIDCNGIHRVQGDLAVARALGDFAFKNADLEQEAQAVSCVPEISITARQDAPQVLVLACDGIWDVIDNDGAGVFLAAQLADHGEIYTAAARMVDECLARGSRDNMSVLLADLNSSFKLGDKPFHVKVDRYTQQPIDPNTPRTPTVADAQAQEALHSISTDGGGSTAAAAAAADGGANTSVTADAAATDADAAAVADADATAPPAS